MENINKKFILNIFIFSILFLGIILRIKGYVLNPSMWYDECNLASSIINLNIQELFFKNLNFNQVAPPLFMVITKINTYVFGINDRTLRLLPEICGILSIFLFYFISKQYFKSNFSITLAIFAFCINSALIYYSTEFKQYSCDVFSVLLVIYLFNKINFETLSLKKSILTGFCISVISWFSFVSLIPIFCEILIQFFIRKTNLKKLSLAILPILLSTILYISIFLYHTHDNAFMLSYWNEKFVKPDLSNFLTLFIQTFQYMFAPIKSTFLLILSFIFGTILFIKERNKIALNLYLTILTTIILSIFKIYPFGDRLILFLIPIYLLIIFKIFDTPKKITILCAIIFATIFYPQIKLNYHYLKVKNINKKEPAKEFAIYLSKNIKPNELIFVNSASVSDFEYYKLIYKIKNECIYEKTENLTKGNRIKLMQEQINSQTSNLWFYMPADIPHRSTSKEITEYLIKTKNVQEFYTVGTSNLVYVKN